MYAQTYVKLVAFWSILMRAVLLLGNFSADKSSREDFFKGECFWDLLSRVELVSLGPAVLK